MNDGRKLKRLLQKLSLNEITPEEALEQLKFISYEDIKIAKIDHHRTLRQGIPEVILAAGKRPEDVVSVARAMYGRSKKFLVTRASAGIYDMLGIKDAVFHPLSGLITAGGERKKKGRVLVVSAGTADLSTAEEAALTASYLGSRVDTLYDVGVAGLHRLVGNMDAFKKAKCIVVVAGMEGALPSVIGGFTDRPIVAVPTSVGYGTSLGGVTALFAMLNSCVPGIAVMNIDNGFGAGCLAHKINSLV